MLDPFVSDSQWSSDKFCLQKVVELFHLPQVVKVQSFSPSLEKSKGFHSDELLVLNSSRNLSIVRATDTLKNEYHIPLDTPAKVEVIWKNYKTFYDHVEELYEDFPAHVLVEDDDKNLGISKGEVLKLKQKTSSQGSVYLQCNVVRRPDVELNIPFDYKGVFKTLGDLTERHVTLMEAVHHCKLPKDVRFIDNKLKMKKVDGSSRYPMGLYNIDGCVTLHEIVDYTDIIAHRLLPDEQVSTITIPLDRQDVEVKVPTAATRGNSSYTQFCSKITQEVSPEILRKIGIEHNHWIIFQDDDGPTSPKDSSSPRPIPKKRTVINSYSVSQNPEQHHGRGSSTSSPPKQIPSQNNAAGNQSPTEVTRKTSQTFPRVLTPTQKNNPHGSTPEIYGRIWLGKIFQENPQQRVEPVFMPKNTFDHSPNLENADGYVTMKGNVFTESMVRRELKKVDKISISQHIGSTGPNHDQSPIAGRKEGLKNRPRHPLPTEISRTDQRSTNLPENQYEEVPFSNVKADRQTKGALPAAAKKKPPHLEYTDKFMKDWSEKDVSRFLNKIGLEKYAKVFKEKKVDGKFLVTLNEPILVNNFKMSNKSHMQKLLKFKEECLKHERSTVQNEYQTS